MREESCVIPLEVLLLNPLTPAHVLVEVKASGTFLLFSAETSTKFWIPDLHIAVLVTFVLFVKVVAHASAFLLYVRLLFGAVLLLNFAAAFAFRVLLQRHDSFAFVGRSVKFDRRHDHLEISSLRRGWLAGEQRVVATTTASLHPGARGEIKRGRIVVLFQRNCL